MAHRLWFGWSLAWIGLFCVLFSPGLILHSLAAPTARTFSMWMRPWARGILWGLRIRRRVLRRGTHPAGPVVYVSNHQSALDVIATSAGLPNPFLYVARHELRSWFIVGTVLEKSACLFIDRSNPRRAVESLKEAGERIRGGESVLIFPEGARSYAHRLDPFMRGAFLVAIAAGVPVVPVTLIGHIGVLNEKTHTARPGTIELVIGEPISTEGLGRADAAALSDQVRAVMEAELARFGAPPA
jgi:1-acyl-sn-glycerol-3-phosphate acyltransferase